MSRTGFIEPCIMTDEEMRACVEQIQAVRPAVEAAMAAYGPRGVRQFRRDYAAGKLPYNKAVDTLQGLADRLLASVVLALGNVAWRFFRGNRAPGVEYDDYLQEACFAAYDYIFSYNGSTSFITGAQRAASNRLTDFIRMETAFSPLSKHAVHLRQAVQREMAGGLSLDEAFAALNLSEDERWECRAAMQGVVREHDFGPDLPLEAVAVAPPDTAHEDSPHDPDLLERALKAAPLTPLEREALAAFQSGEKGYQSKLARKYGKTRAWAHGIFKSACEKVRTTYEGFTQRVAA